MDGSSTSHNLELHITFSFAYPYWGGGAFVCDEENFDWVCKFF